jgi:Family of unknown function (DUF5906)
LRAHVRDIVAGGNPEHFDYIIRWIAWCFQHPGERAQVTLVLCGGQGSGKGILLSAIRKIFGAHGREVSHEDSLTNKFNARFLNLLFCFADEAFWAGDRKGEGVIKKLITDEMLEIEKKGIDPMRALNRMKVAMASNDDWVVPAGEDSRRFAVFNVLDTYVRGKGKTEAEIAKYFEPIWAEMANGGLAAMLHELLNMELGAWHPRHIIQTDALRDQKLATMEVYDRMLHSLLQDGLLPADNRFNTPDSTSNAALIQFIRNRDPNARVSDTALGMYLTKRKGFKKVRLGWQFPPLAEARADFDSRFGKQSWLPLAGWPPATAAQATATAPPQGTPGWPPHGPPPPPPPGPPPPPTMH